MRETQEPLIETPVTPPTPRSPYRRRSLDQPPDSELFMGSDARTLVID